jgi:hypothetical protein
VLDLRFHLHHVELPPDALEEEEPSRREFGFEVGRLLVPCDIFARLKFNAVEGLSILPLTGQTSESPVEPEPYPLPGLLYRLPDLPFSPLKTKQAFGSKAVAMGKVQVYPETLVIKIRDSLG